MTTALASSTPTLTPTYSPSLQQITSSADSPTPSHSPTLAPSSTLTLTLSPTFSPTPSASLIFTWTPTLSPSPTTCPHPLGWLPYTVRSGDTLSKLAIYYRISVADLQRANCLLTTGLLPGSVIYVPPVPTQTPWPCGHPSGWIIYIVQRGDTLYRLSLTYGVTVAQLQQANCLADPNNLFVGQQLYVPPWAATPLPTIPAAATPTFLPTNTPETSLPSDTPVPTDTLFPTDIPVPTETPFPTDIPVPTDTLSPTALPVILG